MQFMTSEFHNIQSEWFNLCVNVNSSKDVKKFTNKYKIVMCVSIYISKCNMQHLNSGFNKFKMDNSTHIKMLIIQKM
jgi:hypothetical protein